jgi:hypothetical protein
VLKVVQHSIVQVSVDFSAKMTYAYGQNMSGMGYYKMKEKNFFCDWLFMCKPNTYLICTFKKKKKKLSHDSEHDL